MNEPFEEPDIPQDYSGMELVLPFVCVKGNGGHLDDQAFTSGWSLGRLWMLMLVQKNTTYQIIETIRKDLVDQLDLMVMHYKGTLKILGTENEWATVLISSEFWPKE